MPINLMDNISYLLPTTMTTATKTETKEDGEGIRQIFIYGGVVSATDFCNHHSGRTARTLLSLRNRCGDIKRIQSGLRRSRVELPISVPGQ